MKAILTFMVFLPLAAPAVGFFRTVPVRAASISGVEAANSATCVERYNTLLMQAKEAVTTGDRAATVEFLHQNVCSHVARPCKMALHRERQR